jgi:hypothetical protein
MKKLSTLKSLIFLTILQLSAGYLVNAAANTAMDEQASALAGAAGLSVNTSLAGIFAVGIQVVLGFLGIIFLFLTLQAGFKWMTSAGNEKNIEEAKGSLKNSIIGLLIVLSAYAITIAVFKYLPFGTGSGGGAAFSG